MAKLMKNLEEKTIETCERYLEEMTDIDLNAEQTNNIEIDDELSM